MSRVNLYLWDENTMMWTEDPNKDVSMLTALAFIEEWKITKKNFIVCIAKNGTLRGPSTYLDFSAMTWHTEQRGHYRFTMYGEVSKFPRTWIEEYLIWRYVES